AFDSTQHKLQFEIPDNGCGTQISIVPRNLSPYLYTKQLSALDFKKNVGDLKFEPTHLVYRDGDWIEVTQEHEGGESNVWEKKVDAVYFPMVVGYIVTVDIIQHVVLVAEDDVNNF
ncbi:hypothetical protein HK100_011874, partial [Physocladia obscura]